MRTLYEYLCTIEMVGNLERRVYISVTLTHCWGITGSSPQFGVHWFSTLNPETTCHLKGDVTIWAMDGVILHRLCAQVTHLGFQGITVLRISGFQGGKHLGCLFQSFRLNQKVQNI